MAKTLGLLVLAMTLMLPLAAEAQVNLDDQNQLLSISGHVTADQKAASQYGLTAISIATISFTIFDVVGRRIYTFAMDYNIITLATVLMLVCLANLRFRKIA